MREECAFTSKSLPCNSLPFINRLKEILQETVVMDFNEVTRILGLCITVQDCNNVPEGKLWQSWLSWRSGSVSG